MNRAEQQRHSGVKLDVSKKKKKKIVSLFSLLVPVALVIFGGAADDDAADGVAATIHRQRSQSDGMNDLLFRVAGMMRSRGAGPRKGKQKGQ